MGASDYQMFRYVLLPAALPVILTGMRMGFTVALLSIIGSETIASLAGLGHRIVHLAEGMDMARMFAYIAFVVAIAGDPQHRRRPRSRREARRRMMSLTLHRGVKRYMLRASRRGAASASSPRCSCSWEIAGALVDRPVVPGAAVAAW